jgi:hypothetical protein
MRQHFDTLTRLPIEMTIRIVNQRRLWYITQADLEGLCSQFSSLSVVLPNLTLDQSAWDLHQQFLSIIQPQIDHKLASLCPPSRLQALAFIH